MADAPPRRRSKSSASNPRGKPERREHARDAIRLKVSYKSARALVTEYTTCVSKGGCRIRSRRELPAGTRFVFEMHSRDAGTTVQVEGEVIRADPLPGGDFEIGVKYVCSPEQRRDLEPLLDRIFAEQQFERVRRHPRVPVNLIATDPADPQRRYLVRDLSRGGIGLRLPVGEAVPEQVKPGRKLVFTVALAEGEPAHVKGEVVWVLQARPGFTQGALGVIFPVVGNRALATLDALLHLERPARLELSFSPPSDG